MFESFESSRWSVRLAGEPGADRGCTAGRPLKKRTASGIFSPSRITECSSGMVGGRSEQSDPPGPSDLDSSRRICRDLLGMAIYRPFGPPHDPRLVFFLAWADRGLRARGRAARSLGGDLDPRSGMLTNAEHARQVSIGVPVVRQPAPETWGRDECGSRSRTAAGWS